MVKPGKTLLNCENAILGVSLITNHLLVIRADGRIEMVKKSI